MASDRVADARERWAEQLMSDEHVLGAVPEQAARLLLDHTLARLDDAAANSATTEALDAEAEAIRAQSRALAEQAAGAEDPEGYLRTVFGSAGAEPAAASAGETAEPALMAGEAAPATTQEPPSGYRAAGQQTPDVAAEEPPAGPPEESAWDRLRGLGKRFRSLW